MEVTEVKRFKSLEEEKSRLKIQLAEAMRRQDWQHQTRGSGSSAAEPDVR